MSALFNHKFSEVSFFNEHCLINIVLIVFSLSALFNVILSQQPPWKQILVSDNATAVVQVIFKCIKFLFYCVSFSAHFVQVLAGGGSRPICVGLWWEYCAALGCSVWIDERRRAAAKSRLRRQRGQQHRRYSVVSFECILRTINCMQNDQILIPQFFIFRYQWAL